MDTVRELLLYQLGQHSPRRFHGVALVRTIDCEPNSGDAVRPAEVPRPRAGSQIATNRRFIVRLQRFPEAQCELHLLNMGSPGINQFPAQEIGVLLLACAEGRFRVSRDSRWPNSDRYPSQ